MAKGGARPGAGRPKGQTQLIRIQSLREALDRISPNVPFVDMLAMTALKFHNDIQQDKNVDVGSRFLLNLSKQVMEPVPTKIDMDNTQSLTRAERKALITNLLTRRELGSINDNDTTGTEENKE